MEGENKGERGNSREDKGKIKFILKKSYFSKPIIKIFYPSIFNLFFTISLNYSLHIGYKDRYR